jgi:hypothetical protein
MFRVRRGFGRKSNIFFVAAVFFFILKLSNFAQAAGPGLHLNYEAMRFRVVTTKYIETMIALRDTLYFSQILFPIRTQAETEKKSADTNPEKIYRQMLAMRSSGEIFSWYRDFLSENELLRHTLQKTFIPAGSNEKEAVFRLGTVDFSINWIWLHPTKDGLSLTAQDEMTQTIADEIWRAGILCYMFEVRISLPAEIRQSPFWEKGMAKIFKFFPSARITEDPLELVFMVFPVSSEIPSIIQRSLELMIS